MDEAWLNAHGLEMDAKLGKTGQNKDCWHDGPMGSVEVPIGTSKPKIRDCWVDERSMSTSCKRFFS